MATINDFGIPIEGGKEGILQPLVRSKPVLIFSVLTDDDNEFLTKKAAGVYSTHTSQKKGRFNDLQFIQDDEFQLIFLTPDNRLLNLLNNLKALSTTAFFAPAVDHQGTGKVLNCYFVTHCRCAHYEVIENRVESNFVYNQIFWTFSHEEYERGIETGKYLAARDVEKKS
jgi:hypothetical protein